MPQQQAAEQAASFVATFNSVILYPTIALLSAVAFLVFLWGCAQYFLNATNDQARQQGIKHITWGIIGLVVMISAWAILKIAASTFGLDQQLNCADKPNDPGCAGVFQIPGSGGPTGENTNTTTGGNTNTTSGGNTNSPSGGNMNAR